MAVAYPWLSLRWRRALKRRWSRQLLEILGIRLKVGAGRTALPPGLIVSNHISWLDIFVINALAPAAFVSKAEVRAWPLIGWLCVHTETIFLERGSRAAAQRTRSVLVAHLRAGDHVALFPEGTTTVGDRVLPFHGALLQSAIDAGRPVLPLALRYVDRHGQPSRAPAYVGEVTLWQTLQAITCTGGLTAELRVLEPVVTSTTCARRALAQHCQAAIAWHLGARHASSVLLPEAEEHATTHLDPGVVWVDKS